MGFYDTYRLVFNAVKTKLEAVSSIKRVVLGEQFRLTKLPMAIINPGPVSLSHSDLGGFFEVTVGVEVFLIIRQTEPADVFADIVAKLDDVIDAVLADQSLSSTVKGVERVSKAVGEIRFREKLYYGGAVRFDAKLFYSPS